MNIEFHPAASQEFMETAAYYESRVPGLGNGFVLELESAIEILRDQVEIGQRFEQDFRRMPLARFPYSLIYRIEPERILVVAVAHQHRHPGYGKNAPYG